MDRFNGAGAVAYSLLGIWAVIQGTVTSSTEMVALGIAGIAMAKSCEVAARYHASMRLIGAKADEAADILQRATDRLESHRDHDDKPEEGAR